MKGSRKGRGKRLIGEIICDIKPGKSRKEATSGQTCSLAVRRSSGGEREPGVM